MSPLARSHAVVLAEPVGDAMLERLEARHVGPHVVEEGVCHEQRVRALRTGQRASGEHRAGHRAESDEQRGGEQ